MEHNYKLKTQNKSKPTNQNISRQRQHINYTTQKRLQQQN
jgi:hypothetical protein